MKVIKTYYALVAKNPSNGIDLDWRVLCDEEAIYHDRSMAKGRAEVMQMEYDEEGSGWQMGVISLEIGIDADAVWQPSITKEGE